MTEAKINNCKFSFKCSKNWSALQVVGIDKQRYCGSCKENVHWCDTQEDIDKAATEKWCVAFSSKPTSQIKNWNSDEDGFLEFHMGRLEMSEDDRLQIDTKDTTTSRVTSWLKSLYFK